jgi:phosphoribosylpyrophosphate synthetase
MVVLRLHNPASCTTDPPMENVDTTKLIIDHILLNFPDTSKIVIGAADMGGSKYSREIAGAIGTPLVIVDKERDQKTGETIAINVYTEGKIDEKVDTVIFADDIINSGNTLKDAGDALFKKIPQISNYLAIATHADFSKDTLGNILGSRFSKIWVTDTVPINKQTLTAIKKAGKETEIISVATLIYNVIENLHNGKSVSALWNGH